MSKLLLIDGDEIVYKIMAAHEEEVDFDRGCHENAWLYEADIYLITNVSKAREAIDTKLLELGKDYDLVFTCFTSTPNFRHDVFPDYKGGRLTKRKPLGYWSEVDRVMTSAVFNGRKIPGLEADDVMSIIATNPKYRKYDCTIYSQDKDMYQVPDCTLIRGEEVSTRSVQEANLFRYQQALTGDRTDGYFGLKTYGPKKAQALLDGHTDADEQTIIDAVVSEYLDRGESLDYAYSQINCACILRYEEYDFEKKEPILKGH